MSQTIINDIPPYTQASGILGQTVFSASWTANYPSDVDVYYTPLGDEPNDATQKLTYPAGYTVTFVGALQQVQVTLTVPVVATGDKVTLVRNTPADRQNLYTNTNFTPSMLNNDFGILTLVDQQAQLVNQYIGPRYNYSATIVDVLDTILPILEANQLWVKNDDNTAIIPYTVPASGIAPAGDTYVLLTGDPTQLPNAFALDTLGTGFLVNDPSGAGLLNTVLAPVANQTTIINPSGLGGSTSIGIAQNPIIPGVIGMGIPSGPTSARVVPVTNISFRFNTDLNAVEYFTGGNWVQLSASAQVLPGNINELAYYAASGSSVSGLATVAAGVLTTAASVPTWVTELSLALGGTNNALTALAGGMVWSDATKLNILAGVAAANRPLLSGNLATPAWGAYALSLGGALSTAGDVTFAGAFPAIFNFTAPTNVIFPVSGTLATTALIPTGAALTRTNDTNVTLTLTGTPTTALLAATDLQLGWTGLLGLNRGGSNANLTAALGGVVYSTATELAISTPLTNGQLLIGSTGLAPVPATLTAGTNITITNGPGTITIDSTGGGGGGIGLEQVILLMGG